MSSFPFLHVGADFLRPPRTEEAMHFPPLLFNWLPAPVLPPVAEMPVQGAGLRRFRQSRLLHELFLNPQFPRRDVTVEPPVSRSVDESATDPIFEAVRQNDHNGLMRALRKRKREPVPLVANDANWTAFHLAASKPECKECLALLLQFDSYSIEMHRDNETDLGETALHIACKYGCEEHVSMLVQKGCNAAKKTNKGQSPLHIAASKGYSTIVRCLLSHGVDIDSRDNSGFTPLHLAAKAGHLDTTGILLVHGASILMSDLEGNLPLHSACQSGTFETASLLLEHNSELLNRKNLDGVTPFMLAIKNFDVGCVQYLLKKGAEIDISDNRGRTTLHFASCLNNSDSFSVLVQSINENQVEKKWISHIQRLDSLIAPAALLKCESYTCLTIQMGLEYLNILLKSHLSQSTLQMPSLRGNPAADSIMVFSPLASLFFHFAEKKNVAFDECLDLLLKHKIIMMDELQRVHPVHWPTEGYLQFINPLSLLLCSTWPNDRREHYFNLLIANNVTTDYCLQCYHDNSTPFETFNNYKVFYGLVIYALEKYALEVVKLLVSNSDILEPDILCNYLIMAVTKHQTKSSTEEALARDMYQYLIGLKPVYHKWYQPLNEYDLQIIPFLPAAEQISDEALAKFCSHPYNYQQSPIFALTEEFIPSVLSMTLPVHTLQPFPYITATEEFANVTLQQLCRTAIRQHLREPTLGDNLRNFRRKVLELPLPNVLKNYLLFKN